MILILALKKWVMDLMTSQRRKVPKRKLQRRK